MSTRAEDQKFLLETLEIELEADRGHPNAYWDNRNLLNAYFWATHDESREKVSPHGQKYDQARTRLLHNEILTRMGFCPPSP